MGKRFTRALTAPAYLRTDPEPANRGHTGRPADLLPEVLHSTRESSE